jgi:hypothetical protein
MDEGRKFGVRTKRSREARKWARKYNMWNDSMTTGQNK